MLWYCGVCEAPCSECLDHVANCEYCEREACKGCSNIYEDCGFRCDVCEEVFIHDKEMNFSCRDHIVVNLVYPMLDPIALIVQCPTVSSQNAIEWPVWIVNLSCIVISATRRFA